MKDNEVIRNNQNSDNLENEISMDTIINDVTIKNEQIKKQIGISNNSTEKILLRHELRLNLVELNVNCLNDFNSTFVKKKPISRM